MRAFDLVAEVLRALKLCPETQIEQRVFRMLKQVGLPPERYAGRFPHEMSGGERQRVGIASALVSEPRLVLADEPVSMLDVSIRAGIMDLLRDLSERMGFSCVYVSHDLSTLSYICDRVAVMYMGQIVETGATRDVIGAPRHPYTQALVAAIPRRGAGLDRQIPIKGELAKPLNPPPGCRFAPRCLEAKETCSVRPAFVELSPGHHVACHERF
jgi:oligopeptide/dipeptide ABC transporter ATP-binding protein